MDYKKIIRSRKIRVKILNLLDFIPDKLMIKIQYRIKTGRKLNLKNPKRYTEKIQWYKVNHRDPLMAQCVDKYEVRDYVRKCGLENILNECYGVYECIDDIDLEKLPNSFVAKDTLGGGGNSVIIVHDKEKIDKQKFFKEMQGWLDFPYSKKNAGREWVYDGRKHRIIIEKYIDSDKDTGGLIDYKFLCFNGKPELIFVMADRVNGKEAGCGLYDVDFRRLPYTESDEPPLSREIEKPSNYEEMKAIAEKLSKNFLCARIDLYNEKNKILFGEITFYDGSGYMCFDPDTFDFELGNKFILE